MTDEVIPIDGFAAWLEHAKREETFAFLYERVEVLQNANHELEKKVQRLKKDRDTLLAFWKVHTHDNNTGRCVLPPDMVNFDD